MPRAAIVLLALGLIGCRGERTLVLSLPPRPTGAGGLIAATEIGDHLEPWAIELTADEPVAIEMPIEGRAYVHYVGDYSELGVPAGRLIAAKADDCVARALPADGQLYALDPAVGETELAAIALDEANAWTSFRYLAPCPCARYAATSAELPGRRVLASAINRRRLLVATSSTFVEVGSDETVTPLGSTAGRVRSLYANDDEVYVGLTRGELARADPALGAPSFEVIATTTSTHVSRVAGPNSSPAAELYWLDSIGDFFRTTLPARSTTVVRRSPRLNWNHGNDLWWRSPGNLVLSQERGEGIIDVLDGRLSIYEWSIVRGDIKHVFGSTRGPLVATGTHELWVRDGNIDWHKLDEVLDGSERATVVGVVEEDGGLLILRSNGLLAQWNDVLGHDCQPLTQLAPGLELVALHRIEDVVIALGQPRGSASGNVRAVFVRRIVD